MANCKIKFTVLIVMLLVAVSVFTQDLPATKPEAVGLTSERLERIAKVVQHNIDDSRIVGAVTMVVRYGRVAWLKAQGTMDREADKPMRPDTMFRICSMTKPITSVAVMMLYEDGAFFLDDPISKYLPEFKNSKVLVKPKSGVPYTVPASREITIRDLLRHTSGIEDYARFCQMMLDGGRAGNVRLLSRKSVELMTQDHLGKISSDKSFGLGFEINDSKTLMSELGSRGEYDWAGFFDTKFIIDPKEQMIIIFMTQLHPTGDLKIDQQVPILAYQAID